MTRLTVFTVIALCSCAVRAQAPLPEKNYLDKILERRTISPEESQSLNRDTNPVIDVRDLVIYLNGLPISATFLTGETLAFHSQGTVTLPIVFSKPVTGTLKFDLGGTATPGAGKDFTLNPAQITLNNSRNASVTVIFEPWRGVGGEKIIRLSLNRQQTLAPANGSFSSHILRIRQFTAGEYVGLLSFQNGSGLPSLPVRVGLDNGGAAVCAFDSGTTLFGGSLALSWTPGPDAFPAFATAAPITLPGAVFSRTTDIHGTLVLSRMTPPFTGELAAYLGGFPATEQPAVYSAVCTLTDLFAAGGSRPNNANPFAVVHAGTLTLRPVSFASAP